MSNTSPITRNISLLYDLAQLDIPVQRLSSRHYRFTLPGKGTWDYNPGRNTVKLVGTGLDIVASPDVVEWVREKMKG